MKTRNNGRPLRAGARTSPRQPHRATKSGFTLPNVKIRRILLPMDFSSPAQTAMGYAEALARQFSAQLVLFHVVEPITSTADFGYGPVVCRRPDPHLIKRSRKHLRDVCRRLLDSKYQCDALVRSGVAFDEISKAAKELEVDLIIIATRDRTGTMRALRESTAERVVRCATCPVLVVHEKEPEVIPQPVIARSHYCPRTAAPGSSTCSSAAQLKTSCAALPARCSFCSSSVGL